MPRRPFTVLDTCILCASGLGGQLVGQHAEAAGDLRLQHGHQWLQTFRLAVCKMKLLYQTPR